MKTVIVGFINIFSWYHLIRSSTQGGGNAGAIAQIGHGREWNAELRAARRPKPPSLAEEALTLLDDASTRLDAVHENTIRRALERLQELERGNE